MNRPEDPMGSPFYRPIRSGNAFEDTVQRLLQIVRLGVAEPGTSLPSERELALRLNVSRDTVREAIRVLAEAGYLESKRGRYGGTFVVDGFPRRPADTAIDGSAPSAVEISDALAVREVLEVGIVRAATRVSLGKRERSLLTERLRESRAAGEDDYRRLDAKFHLTLAELTGSATLVALLGNNRMLINGLLDRIPLIPANIEHSNQQHADIVTALLAGDEDAAAAAAREHLDGTKALLMGFLS